MGIRDDLIRAMKKDFMADFSKAFDTVHYGTLLTKLHTLCFSKSFLTWLTSYLSNRSQYMFKLTTVFRVLTRFSLVILGPMLFNLCVEDLQDMFSENIRTFQYAVDTNVYSSFRPVDLPSLPDLIPPWNNFLAGHVIQTSLLIPKTMVISTRQMAHFHSLDAYKPNLQISQTMVQRVTKARLLGVQLHTTAFAMGGAHKFHLKILL